MLVLKPIKGIDYYIDFTGTSSLTESLKTINKRTKKPTTSSHAKHRAKCKVENILMTTKYSKLNSYNRIDVNIKLYIYS